MKEKKVIIITGPTGVGKTSFSIQLAKELETEIISADSMQIYKGLDIGTDKVSRENQKFIKHHQIDIVSPNGNYTVQNFQRDSYRIIDELHERNKIPIIVGGTGLYIDSIIYDFKFAQVEPDNNLRKKYESLYEKKGGGYLLDIIKKIDLETYNQLNPKDKKKIIRFLEVYESSGKILRETKQDKEMTSRYNIFAYVFTNDREILYNNINNRVDQMMEKGLIDEVSNIIDSGVTKDCQSMKAIGYKEVIPYLENSISYEDMVKNLKKNSRRYAKRQLTWFRRNPYLTWIDKSESKDREILKMILHDINFE